MVVDIVLFVVVFGAVLLVASRLVLTSAGELNALEFLPLILALATAVGVILARLLRSAARSKDDEESFRRELNENGGLLVDAALDRRYRGIDALVRLARDTQSAARHAMIVDELSTFIRRHEPGSTRRLRSAPVVRHFLPAGATACPRDLEEALRLLSWLASKPDTGRPDLTGADLSGLRLNGVNLFGAVLDDVNLHRASLDGADLRGARCHGADLRGASLDGAELDDACFSGARLPPAVPARLSAG